MNVPWDGNGRDEGLNSLGLPGSISQDFSAQSEDIYI